MLGARDFVALTGHETPVETHSRRGGDDFPAVVSIVVEANQVDHGE
jgi:hypothetical protein